MKFLFYKIKQNILAKISGLDIIFERAYLLLR